MQATVLASQLGKHVVHYGCVLCLRAEQHDLGVVDDAHAVPGWPVEKVLAAAGLLGAVVVAEDDLAGDHEPPMRGVARVVMKPLEGTDADRNRVSSTVVSTTVAALRTKPKPSTYPRNNRVTTTEFHIWALTAYLTQYRQESDGGIHLAIKDSAGRRMIAELPYGSCVPSTSRWRAANLSARSAFGHTYAVSTSWHYVRRLMDLRGVGFMDTVHGQTGVAPNGVELHPVIYVRFR